MTHPIDREALEGMAEGFGAHAVICRALLAIAEILDNKQDKPQAPPADADLLRRQIRSARTIVEQGGYCHSACEDCPRGGMGCAFKPGDILPWMRSWLSAHDPEVKRPNLDALDGEKVALRLRDILLRYHKEYDYFTSYAIRDIIAAVKEVVGK
jgi:hypothetical protein